MSMGSTSINYRKTLKLLVMAGVDNMQSLGYTQSMALLYPPNDNIHLQ